jgi:putative membrane protein insertion efficiency factor
VKRLLIAVLVAPIRLYQRLISPAFAPRCRYYPTCSEYAVQALRELGPVRGSILAG